MRIKLLLKVQSHRTVQRFTAQCPEILEFSIDPSSLEKEKIKRQKVMVERAWGGGKDESCTLVACLWARACGI